MIKRFWKKHWKKFVFVAVLAGVLTAGWFYGVKPLIAKIKGQVINPDDIVTVKKDKVEVLFTGSGTVTAKQDVKVTSKPSGILKAVYVKEGDELSSYGIDAKIIELPGHTDGSIGVDVEGQSLLVGDALDNWISPATGHLYSDIDKLKDSAQKIRALGERKLYYGHGKPTINRFK